MSWATRCSRSRNAEFPMSCVARRLRPGGRRREGLMASQLISTAQSLLTPELVSRVAAQTGESDSSISKAFGGVIPLVFAAIANQSDNRALMSQIASLASKAPSDANDTLRTVTEGSAAPASIDPNVAPGAWLSSLFATGTSSLADVIARYAGIKGS